MNRIAKVVNDEEERRKAYCEDKIEGFLKEKPEEYSGYILEDETGIRYFSSYRINGFITKTGKIFPFPEEIEFRGECEETCYRYRNGACQTSKMDLINVVFVDRDGRKYVGTACAYEAFQGHLCGFYPIWDLVERQKWLYQKETEK